jgi:hypothetical protein
MDKEFTLIIFIPPEITGTGTSSGTTNPPEEKDSAGIQTFRIKMRGKSSERLQYQNQQLQIFFTANANYSKILTMKTSSK